MAGISFQNSSRECIKAFASANRLDLKEGADIAKLVKEIAEIPEEKHATLESYFGKYDDVLRRRQLRSKTSFCSLLLPVLGSSDAVSMLSVSEAAYMAAWEQCLPLLQEELCEMASDSEEKEHRDMPSDSNEEDGGNAAPTLLKVSDIEGTSLKEAKENLMLGQRLLFKVVLAPNSILHVPQSDVRKYNLQVRSPDCSVHIRASYKDAQVLHDLFREYEGKVVLAEAIDMTTRTAPGAEVIETFAKISASSVLREVYDDTGAYANLTPIMSPFRDVPSHGDYAQINLTAYVQSKGEPQDNLTLFNLVDVTNVPHILLRMQAWRIPIIIMPGRTYELLNIDVDLAWRRVNFTCLSKATLLEHDRSRPTSGIVEAPWPDFRRAAKAKAEPSPNKRRRA